jgi:hypothetical protein
MWRSIPILRALGQSSNEVVVRVPGDRFLSAPEPIGPYAAEHSEFAWLSDAAYIQTKAGRRHFEKIRANLKPENADPAAPVAHLNAAGWKQWDNFPDAALRDKIVSTHLRVQVWERSDPPAFAVTFGGTVFNNDADWRANLRWFVPMKRDEYSDVVQTFAPAFSEELKRRSESMDKERFGNLELYSTGHSLGGGLAQQFAYSVPPECLKRVKKVYAFDPSPVTGFFSVKLSLRTENKKGLLIDRIYERGEILALFRSLMSLFYKPSKINAAIRGVRYNVFFAWNPIAAHSIVELAENIDTARGDGRNSAAKSGAGTKAAPVKSPL